MLLKLLSQRSTSWISNYQLRWVKPQWVIEELDLPKFTGGLVGYFGYDTIQYVEPRVAKTLPENDPIGSADILLMRSDDVVVFDNLSGMLTLIRMRILKRLVRSRRHTSDSTTCLTTWL